MYRVQYGEFAYCIQFNTGKNHISNDDEQEQTVSLPGERVMRIEKITIWATLYWYNARFSWVYNKELYNHHLGE